MMYGLKVQRKSHKALLYLEIKTLHYEDTKKHKRRQRAILDKKN